MSSMVCLLGRCHCSGVPVMVQQQDDTFRVIMSTVKMSETVPALARAPPQYARPGARVAHGCMGKVAGK